MASPNENDIVNHPKHYCRENGMESIDEMVLVFGVEAVKHFCLCNVWKYRYRAADKNGEEDLKKSDWYMRKYKELEEKEKNSTVISQTKIIDTIPNGQFQPTSTAPYPPYPSQIWYDAKDNNWKWQYCYDKTD